MNRFLNFNEMITPSIILIIYWCGIASIIIGGIGSIIGASHFGFNIGAFLLSIIGMAACVVGWRVWCELMLVIFSINGKLHTIEKNCGRTL